MVIIINDTEYRVIRCHKPIVIRSDEVVYLRKIHKNMIAYMIETYGNSEWSAIIKKFLKWSTNPTHHKVMQRWVSGISS
jgi:hypothetical protein